MINQFKALILEHFPGYDLSMNEVDDQLFLDSEVNAMWMMYQICNAWEDIETAPKDGRSFLAAYEGKDEAFKAHFVNDRYAKTPKPYWGGEFASIWGTREARKTSPVKWRPIPIPPLTTEGGV